MHNLRDSLIALAWLAFLTLPSTAFAQPPNLWFENYKVADGLSQTSAKTVYQDKLGFIWVGTQDGLNRFDGYQFKHYKHDPQNPQTLSANSIFKIIEDATGTMWVLNRSGLDRYNDKTDSFERFDLSHPDFLSVLNPNIHQILTDSTGLIWAATTHGLLKFTPSKGEIKKYQFEPNNLSNNKLWALFEDKDNTLWIGSYGGGLIKYNRNTDDFSHFAINNQSLNTQGANRISSIAQSRDGYLWIGTYGAGLFEFNQTSGAFTSHQHNPKTPSTQLSNKIWDILIDNNDNFWVRSEAGLNRFDVNRKTFTRQLNGQWVQSFYQDKSGKLWVLINNKPSSRQSEEPFDYKNLTYWARKLALYDSQSQQFKFHLKNKGIHQFFEDNQHNLWAATGAGLSLYNHKTQYFKHFEHHPAQQHTLPDNAINAAIQAQSGIIWLGTDGGLSKLNLAQQRFGFVKYNPKDTNSLTHGAVGAIYQAKSGSIWIGTTNGLNHYNPLNGRFKHYQHQPNNPQSLSNNHILAITEDNQGNLWVGTANGLNRFNAQSQIFTQYKTDPKDQNAISNNYINTILLANDNKLWIGTNRGLNAFNNKTQSFKRYDGKAKLSNKMITSLYQNQQGNLWIGTRHSGINRYDPKTESLQVFAHNPKDRTSISHNFIFSIHQDNTGQLWVGTVNGLNRFNPKDQTFTQYHSKDGLPSDRIAAIMNDEQGNLWLGTFKGIVKFNPKTQTFKTYTQDDGAFCFDITAGAFYQASDGQLFLGSDKGYCGFYPQNIKDDLHAPNVVLTDFKLLNKSVALEHSLNYSLNYLPNQSAKDNKPLTLTHEDSLFSFDFAALHFASPKKNQYQYKLEGFDKNWIATDAANRRATYTNIPSGKYTFRVKGSNKDGVWSEQDKSIQLIIKPAPWRTWWAYLIYLFVFGTIVSLINYQRYQHQNRLVVAKNNAEKANRAKSTFIANVSHEIRTPLNAILGYTQMLDRDTTVAPKHKQKIEIIEKSGLHLLGLINDILDISKIEADAMQLLNVDFELVELIEDLALMFDGRCVEKQLDWHWHNRCDESLLVFGDEGKLRQILINLLGNAVKFTSSGSITLTLDAPQPNHYRFTVSDTGIGITPGQQRQIFKAFGQTNSGSKYGGTGLGLAIASKQVALMGGQLHCNSEPCEGSRFYFTLPLSPAKAPIESHTSHAIRELKLAPGVSVSALIVDDIKENRDILSQILSDAGINIHEAVNGQEALDYLHQCDQNQSLPDLIFMDIRMPIMNGIKAMQAIKRDLKDRCPTCIVITAQAMAPDVDRYLNEGFDHYIAKPFRFEAVYECLVQLLEVEFEQHTSSRMLEQTQEQALELSQLDLSTLTIPPALHQSIIDAATIYEVSKLEGCLEELTNLGKQGQQLAKVLSQYISDYDMDGLLSELSKITRSDD